MKVVSIAKNTSFFTLALILQKIISFSYFAILARNLVPEDLGRYYLAISFTTIFAIIIDLGLANVLTREIAKYKSKKGIEAHKDSNELLQTALFLKIPLALISLILVFLVGNILSYSKIVMNLIYISCISMVLDSFTITFWSYIRAHHVLKYESFGVVFFQVVTFGLGLTAIKLDLGLLYLIMAMATASILTFLYALIKVKLVFEAKIMPMYNKDMLKSLVYLSLPFAAYAVLQRLYMYLDSVLLAVISGELYVGLYQVPFKIIFALQFLPMAFMASLYPAFALYYKENQKQLSISFERSLNYLWVVSLPIALGVFSLSDKIISIFKPEYIEANWLLKIVILSLPFMFINFPIGSLLNACDRQKINTRNMFLVLLFSVGLNIFLINKYQAIGASLTVLLTNFLMFYLGSLEAWKIVKLDYFRLFIKLGKIILSTALMTLFTLYMKDELNVFINIAISAIIYISLILITKVVSRDDIMSVMTSLKPLK